MKSIYLIVIALLGSCAQPPATSPKPNNCTEPDAEENCGGDGAGAINTVNVSMSWGTPELVRNGLREVVAFSPSIQQDPNGGEFWGLFCFENPNRCVRANTEVRNEIGNNAVGIQDFQLNFTKGTGTVITITGASVTTADLKFNITSGQPFFDNRHTRFLQGTSSCNLNSTDESHNDVGMPAGVAGREKILAGLFLFDEASQGTSGAFSNGVMTAGRVHYSGLVPLNSTAEATFAFSYSPETEAAEADFGRDQFAGTSSTGVMTSDLFGLDETYATAQSIPRFKNHFIIGWCFEGTKRVGTAAPRPLILGAWSRAYRPVMKLKTN